MKLEKLEKLKNENSILKSHLEKSKLDNQSLNEHLKKLDLLNIKIKDLIDKKDSLEEENYNLKTYLRDKIYEVIELINDNIVVITDNLGDQANYVMISDTKVWFEDATPYIREETLNKLGI